MKSTQILKIIARIQSERAQQYDPNGNGERSFAAAAQAFNAVTGRDLKGSDVCLILEFVKLVRQYSKPERLHDDSVIDKVSYSSLWAEELMRELSAAEWPESDGRVNAIGQNGNEGLHYEAMLKRMEGEL